jgi:hypothetical protein
MINDSGTYDSNIPATQAQGTLAAFQNAAMRHPEMLQDHTIASALQSGDANALQAAMSTWLKTHDPSYDPNNLYKIQNGTTTPNSGSAFSDNLPLITALMAAGLITPAVFAALSSGGATAAGGTALADLGPSTSANIAATGAAGAAPAGIAATGGGVAAGAGGAAAASTPWWQTAIKAGAPLAATALTRGIGGGGDSSPLDPTMQANIQSLLDLSMQRAKETAPIHQAAMALALHLAPTYARANGLPPSPLSTPSITNPTTTPSNASPATSAAFDALLHGRSGGY